MTIACPCCGQSIILDEFPKEALKHVPMPNLQRRILDALLDAYPVPLNRDQLIDACYFDDPNGGPDQADNVVKSTMSKLRQRITVYGWIIPASYPGKGNLGRYQLQPVGRDAEPV